jgi:tetratricopeptide (TPR) repeat protein
MRRAISSVAFVVLTLVQCPISMAQEPATGTSWDACHKVPTRACLLDEALTRALSAEPSEPRSTLLGNIAETQAAAGNIQTALRIAPLIPSDQASRANALRSIASAQAHLGLTAEARETFSQARQVADALEDQLSRAEVLHSVAKAEAEAGMPAEATSTFDASWNAAKALEIPARSPCESPGPEVRLDVLLKTFAEQQATAGDISNSLQTARLIKYMPEMRVRALRTIAETQGQRGPSVEAGLILKEALEAASQTPPERWPSCPGIRHLPAGAEAYMGTLFGVAEAQARIGLTEDASATFATALQSVPAIKDGPVAKADVSRSLVLTRMAEAQSEAGFGPQSAEMFERAVQAASEVRETYWHVWALTRLGRAQYQVGRVAEATRTFDDALELARTRENYPERASGLLTVLDAEVEVGLAVDTDTILLRAIEATRSIPDQSKRAFLLVRIAQAQEKAGRHQSAVDTYREALQAVDATGDKWARINSLFGTLRGWSPSQPQLPRLITESAPQIMQIAQSIEDELRRADALVLIAKALPN